MASRDAIRRGAAGRAQAVSLSGAVRTFRLSAA